MYSNLGQEPFCSRLTLLYGCALGERSSGVILKFRTSSFKCYVDHSHTVYSSGNIDVRNWVHLFESPCILKFTEPLTFQDMRVKLNNETVSFPTLHYYRVGISLSLIDVSLTSRNINWFRETLWARLCLMQVCFFAFCCSRYYQYVGSEEVCSVSRAGAT